MGILVSSDKVDQAAKKIECAILQVHFSSLGSKVGCLMSRIQSWSEIVNNILTRLSKWKLKTLSIGGRLTLLKSVIGSLPIYHMSLFKVPTKVLLNMESIRCHFFNGIEHKGKKPIWVKWNKVLASKEKGGLGVSSFYALNRALLFKWVWRFCTQQSALWTKIIKGIHGEDGKIGKHVRSHHPSLWLDIVKEVQHIQRQGTDLMGFIHRKMGNGVDIRFWEDKWRGDNTFQSDFPRMYALETQKNISVALKLSHDDLLCSFRRAPRAGAEELQYIQLVKIMEGITLFDSKDRWRWSLEGCGEFTVASVRNLLDANSLPVVSSKTRWIKAVPIKVNIHAWKVKLDILPTRLNISKRGMDIESILCPLCEKNVESSSHIFFTCPISREIFRKVLLWWEIDVVMVSSYDEWLEWLLSIRTFNALENGIASTSTPYWDTEDDDDCGISLPLILARCLHRSCLFSDGVEIISDLQEDNKIIVYRCGPLVDLCCGPHAPNTTFVKAIACLKASTAYWRGNKDHERLQRVYGISYPDQKRLKSHSWVNKSCNIVNQVGIA
ncbi:RNA-directed DNA polymerase, eukaryota, reverse transcriptase zinc-binding domain protein [Tanacetum coccineum]